MKSVFHGLTAVCLLFSRHFIISGQSQNAFYYMQSAGDYMKVTGFFIALWVVISLILHFIYGRWPQRYMRVVIALLLISLLPLIDLALFIAGIKPGIKGIARIIYPLFCFGYVPGIIIIALFVPLEKVFGRTVPVFFTLGLLAVFYAVPRTIFEPIIDKDFVEQDGAPPVHIILFDETSYYLLFNPELREDFTNIYDFASQSYVFTNAYSPGIETLWSIPKLLTGTDYRQYRESNDNLYISRDSSGTFEKLPVEKSIFKIARDYDYNTVLIGGYIPYCDIFGDYLTYGRQYRNSPILAGMTPWPITKILYLNRFKINTFFHEFDDYMSVMRKAPVNTMYYVHFLIPHWPYLFDENGVGDYYWNTLIHSEDYLKQERFEAQTKYCDKKFGEILDEMKSNGTYDQSLVIFISDHAEKDAEDRTRIPLFVKAPYQQERVQVNEEVRTIRLNILLERFFEDNTVDVSLLMTRN